MSVVQRCPSCGTTQGAPGECEACHEAHVRHFCTNHDPGRWLDANRCPTCEARAAEAARVAAPPRVPPARPEALRGRDLGFAPTAAPRAPWPEVLTSSPLARARPAEAASADEVMPMGRALGGCVTRVLLIAVFLALALAAAAYFLARAVV